MDRPHQEGRTVGNVIDKTSSNAFMQVAAKISSGYWDVYTHRIQEKVSLR